jgi:hypothetical protein
MAARTCVGWSRTASVRSLEPIVERLGGEADYQSTQQFLTDSPWDPALVVKAVAERVAPVIDVEAWVLDDTGFPSRASVPRVSSASIRGRWGRSVTARSASRCTRPGRAGPCRWGGRCIYPRSGVRTPSAEHRQRPPGKSSSRRSSSSAKSSSNVLGAWNIKRAPVLGDEAYGKNTQLRQDLEEAGFKYVLSIDKKASVLRPRRPSRCPSAPGKPAGQGHTAAS